MVPCERLPLPLHVCPVCEQGIKPNRGFAWIDALRMFGPKVHGSGSHAKRCPLTSPPERAGLIWVGGVYYSTESFNREAVEMGVSRRITAIPRDFTVGKTLVLLGHRETPGCDPDDDSKPGPAIFTAFRPQRIDYVVKPSDSKGKLEALEERGVRLVRVIPVEDEVAA